MYAFLYLLYLSKISVDGLIVLSVWVFNGRLLIWYFISTQDQNQYTLCMKGCSKQYGHNSYSTLYFVCRPVGHDTD